MIALFLTAALAGPSTEKVPEVPVAVLAVLKGSATLEHAKKKRPACEADLLLPGDRVEPGTMSEVVLVFLNDGHREKLKGRAVRVSGTGCSPRDAVERMEEVAVPSAGQLNSLRLHTRSIQSRGGRSAVGELRGEKEEIAVVTPMFGSRVLTDHPTLSWPAVAGANGYRVELLTGVQRPQRVLWRAETKATHLPYPEEEPVLEDRLLYRWRVYALTGKTEKLVAASKFFVAGKDQAASLRRVAALAADTNSADWLLAAMVYEAAGVYDKALPLFQKLAERSPEAINYQTTLARYYERAGRKDLAGIALERVKKLRGE